MTNGGSGDVRRSKNQRREDAREKARILREQQKKQDRRRRVLLQGGLIVVALAIVAVVTLVIVNSIRPPGPGPRNMLSDGILIGENFEAVPTPALPAGEKPVETVPDPDSDAIAITIYLDYLCPICGQFEDANAEQITTLVETGAATIEIHPVAILDSQSQGTKYSTRAANAAACVANYSPNSYYDFSARLFAEQPEEGTTGLTDEQLIEITQSAEVGQAAKISDCILDPEFDKWVADATQRATNNAELLNDEGQFGTPTVFVDGNRYPGAPNDATAFAQFIAAADGENFSEESSASPSPSPSPAP